MNRRQRAALLVLMLAMLLVVAALSGGCSASASGGTTASLEPVPDQLWQKAWKWERRLQADPGLEVCRLLIPRLGLDLGVLQMTDEELLDKGPGHWPETPLPGMGGGFVISGHRSTYGSPFARLGELVVGDTIEVVLPYAVAEYKVARIMAVGPEEVDVVQSRGVEELSLVTCHPPGSEKYRLVVQAVTVSFDEGGERTVGR